MSDEATTSLLGYDPSGAVSAPPGRPYPGLTDFSASTLTAFSRGYFPDLLGIENLEVEPQHVRDACRCDVS